MRYHHTMSYQAIIEAPFGALGIKCGQGVLTGIDFLPPKTPPQPPCDKFARQVCDQLRRYFDNPDSVFDLPLKPRGTPHQQRVWQAMLEIPRGSTLSYGEMSKRLNSGAQAVGQACGANPIPVIIPCHRVVGRSGLGGFMKHGEGDPLEIKRWLLAHEGALRLGDAGFLDEGDASFMQIK